MILQNDLLLFITREEKKKNDVSRFRLSRNSTKRMVNLYVRIAKNHNPMLLAKVVKNQLKELPF